jgi:nucleoside-diphosphate-sugar epimerase
MSKRTLVSGGAGYVGSVLVAELLSTGRQVRVMDSLIHGSIPSLLIAWGQEGFEFVQIDVRDRDACRATLEGVDEVVHLAAIVGDPACARQPELAREVNLEGTLSLLDEAKAASVGRFVFASTCSNYGKSENGAALATEDWELRPVSLYAETKVDGELAVLGRSGPNFSTCCLRLATVYGASPRMRFDLTVNEFARDLLLGGDLVVYGEQFWRPYVHVRDAARAIRAALDAPRESVTGEVFNAGDTAENYRKLDIVELLKKRVSNAEIQFVKKDDDPRDYRVSFEKIKTSLAFEAKRTVADGIDEIMALLRSGLLEDPYSSLYRN